jgi:hypothetical protein
VFPQCLYRIQPIKKGVIGQAHQKGKRKRGKKGEKGGPIGKA